METSRPYYPDDGGRNRGRRQARKLSAEIQDQTPTIGSRNLSRISWADVVEEDDSDYYKFPWSTLEGVVTPRPAALPEVVADSARPSESTGMEKTRQEEAAVATAAAAAEKKEQDGIAAAVAAETKKQEEAAAVAAAGKKRQEKAAATEKKKQEEAAAAAAAAAAAVEMKQQEEAAAAEKKRQEEAAAAAATAAAEKKRQEEAAAAAAESTRDHSKLLNSSSDGSLPETNDDSAYPVSEPNSEASEATELVIYTQSETTDLPSYSPTETTACQELPSAERSQVKFAIDTRVQAIEDVTTHTGNKKKGTMVLKKDNIALVKDGANMGTMGKDGELFLQFMGWAYNEKKQQWAYSDQKKWVYREDLDKLRLVPPEEDVKKVKVRRVKGKA